MTTSQHSLPQSERINSKKTIDRLFKGGGSKAMTASPLRVVYMAGKRDEDSREPLAQMMVSVPKRYFKRAVKRNRIKRQVREAYRLNKQLLTQTLAGQGTRTVHMCFIWTADRMLATQEVEQRMKSLLTRLGEKMAEGERTPASERAKGKEYATERSEARNEESV